MAGVIIRKFSKKSAFLRITGYFLNDQSVELHTSTSLKELKKDERHVLSEDSLTEARNRALRTRQAFKIKSDRLKTRINYAKRILKEKVEVMRRENVWTVPNVLCMSRIAICPYLGYTILTEEYPTALCIFVVAGISDVCDGYIARNFKSQATVLGSLLDPLADKLLIGTMYLSLSCAGMIPPALTLIVMVRDLMLTSAGLYLRFATLPQPKLWADFFDPSLPTVRVKPSRISKVNTGVQVLTAATSLALPAFNMADDASSLLVVMVALWWTTAITTTASLVTYVLSSSSAYKLVKNTKG